VAHPQIAVFARLAENDAKPVRKVDGQKTMLGRTMHSIAYDYAHDEFVVPQQFGQAILTFRGDANGEEAPIRVIQGSKTQLRAPDHLAMDPVHGEIYVPDGDKVLVFDRLATGNVAPIRVIEGPDTGLGANIIGADPVNGYIIVWGNGGNRAGGNRIRIFDRMANGNVKPEIVITGPRNPDGPFAVYPPKKLLISPDRNGPEGLASADSYMGIWSYAQSGDQPPLWRIGGPRGVFLMPKGVALDVKDQDIIITDKRLNSVLTFHFPQMF
jgi:DNA-binding beta-propeller fold protein YncE